MSTTSILVEILIIGMQAVIWVALLVLSLFGYRWLPDAAVSIKGWEPVVSIFGLGLCYCLGIFVDRAADCLTVLYHPGDTLLRFAWIKRHADAAHRDIRMQVLCADNRAGEFLAHIRSRIRIARATSVNLLICTLATVVFLAARTAHGSALVLGCVALVGIVLSLLSVVGLGVLEVTYYTRLKQAKLYVYGKGEAIAEGER